MFYLDGHLSHKDGGEDVVGDGEKDPLLVQKKRELKEGKKNARAAHLFLQKVEQQQVNIVLPRCLGGSWASPGPP